eukprot:COSAG02_NODE_3344_length_6897_cov_73.676670_3_plen_229_part_00
MKTRKYKDNQQRKKFAQNESKILLIQYFKKKETESTVQSFSSNSEVIRNGKGTHSSQVSTAAKTLRIPKVSQSCLANSNPNYKKWSSFKYPKNLSAFFLERPSLKSTYLLLNLKDHVSQLETEGFRSGRPRTAQLNAKGTQLASMHNSGLILEENQSLDLIKVAIKDLAFKVCYSKKAKQQQNKTRIRGRCIQTNRPRSVSRLLRLSRIRIRTLALEGKITGCTRSTW